MTDWMHNQMDEINDIDYRRWQRMKPDREDWTPKGTRITKSCTTCGAEGLHWINYNGGFRLGEADESLHICNKDKSQEYQQKKAAAQKEFIIDAVDVGFSEEQASFLWLKFGKK